MKKNILQFLMVGLAFFVVCALTPAAVFAGVNVYAEGAYDSDDLVVYIYADIDGGTELRSAGVKLTYSTTELTVNSTAKNDTAWFLGSETYMAPDTSTPGEVTIILGKLDTAAPTEGVSGTRVLLGKIRFDRAEATMPFVPTLSMGLGKSGDFANFVDTTTPIAVEMDASVTFGTITVRERGDANGDGTITVLDIRTLRQNLGASDTPPWVDCDGDGSVGVLDVRCVKTKM